MPFKSKSPELLHKKAAAESFWDYAFKQAAEAAAVVPAMVEPEAGAAVEEAPVQQSGRLLKWNALGGVDSRTPEEMQRAQTVDLVTLPQTVEAASCASCEYFNPTANGGFCSQEAVMQGVSERMVCSLWDAPGTYRAWEAQDLSAVAPSQVGPDGMPVAMPMDAPMDAPMPDGQLPLPGGPAGMQAEGPQPAEAPEAAPPPEVAEALAPKAAPKKDSEKDSKPKKDGSAKPHGSTININVGHAKKASLADLLRG